MSIFEKIIVSFLIIAGMMLPFPLHAQEEESGFEPYINIYQGLAANLACGKIIEGIPTDDGVSMVFIPLTQSSRNWSRKLDIHVWHAPFTDEEEVTDDEVAYYFDYEEIATLAKYSFLDILHSRGKITLIKQEQRASGAPAIYAEFTSGQDAKLKSGIAMFIEQAPGFYGSTILTVKGALDEASRKIMRNYYYSMLQSR